MKKILIILTCCLFCLYVYIFVIPKEVRVGSQISIRKVSANKLSFQLTDSYYFIDNINAIYSIKKDTLNIIIEKSSLANIFKSKKMGYVIMDIDSNVKVVGYCGIFILKEEIPLDSAR